MARTLGAILTERIGTALVEGNRIAGDVRSYPDEHEEELQGMHADALANELAAQMAAVLAGQQVDAIGIGVPGVIRNGVIEESPNLQQLKGFNMRQAIEASLLQKGIRSAVRVCNDADVMAAGIAAVRGQLDQLIRVWTIGNGIGFGIYPTAPGVWEGGHSVVTLDSKEAYCGCGGVGHLEGIMGHRAIRLRFLDLEPDEVFEDAKRGDTRCADFVKLWHKALAAATATSVHMAGPGKFYLTGPNSRWVQIDMLNRYMQKMVKMSPLQGYAFEVVPGGQDLAIIGAAVNAARAAQAL
jgi:predicted NBD/HSP70 family sugar kinase